MAWLRDGDVLKSDGVPHYDVDSIRQLIEELRESKKGKPEKVCSLLEQLLSAGTAAKELVWTLSKWCDWKDYRESAARSIAGQLFHGIVCRRLWNQKDIPIPDLATAEADYQTWLDSVVEAGKGLRLRAVFPDEVEQNVTYLEGAVRSVSVNAYERSPEAREACLAHYGTKFFVCHFDFAEAYSGVGEGFIHVHHLKTLAEIGREYRVDPISDLRPVCPNCHAVIHLYRKPFSIKEVIAMVDRSRGSGR